MRQLLLVSIAVIMTACSGHSHDHSHHTSTSQADGEGIVISAARILPPFPGRDIAAGYFEITNHGQSSDQLISASSPVSGIIEIHNHIEEDGVMKMRQVRAVDLPVGETVSFKPGSFHLMMFETNLPDGEDSIPVTLNYKNSSPVTLIVDIEGHEGDENYGSSHSGKDEGYGSSHGDKDKSYGSHSEKNKN